MPKLINAVLLKLKVFSCGCATDFCWLSLSILIDYALGKLENHSHQLHKLHASFLWKNCNKLQMHEKTRKWIQNIRTQEFLNTHTKLLLCTMGKMLLIDYHIKTCYQFGHIPI
jgi:hypothetical protein